MKTLVPVLGDQLSLSLSSLRDADRAETVVLMMEVAEETTYVRHHKQKIAYILSAMRHHAAALARAGWTVDYVRLDDPENAGSFTGEIARAVQRHAPERIVVTEAGEWRVAAMIEGWETLFGIPVEPEPVVKRQTLVLEIGRAEPDIPDPPFPLVGGVVAAPGREQGKVVGQLTLGVVRHRLKHDMVVGIEPVDEGPVLKRDPALGGNRQSVTIQGEPQIGAQPTPG